MPSVPSARAVREARVLIASAFLGSASGDESTKVIREAADRGEDGLVDLIFGLVVAAGSLVHQYAQETKRAPLDVVEALALFEEEHWTSDDT